MSLIDTASREAERNGAKAVRAVSLSLGTLCGVEPEALSFCFPIAARETPCEGAELKISMVAAKGTCGRCGARSEVSDPLAPCPACGDWPLAIEGGRDMRLESLEVI
jgi:hydrogenase nickel incorporation protein HypA/HybF